MAKNFLPPNDGLIEIEFVRQTNPFEDSVVHLKGSRLRVVPASVERWVRRKAAILAAPKAVAPIEPPAPTNSPVTNASKPTNPEPPKV